MAPTVSSRVSTMSSGDTPSRSRVARTASAASERTSAVTFAPDTLRCRTPARSSSPSETAAIAPGSPYARSSNTGHCLLADASDLVAADLALADRDLDAEVELVGEVAGLLQAIDPPRLEGRATVAEVDPVADLELLIEMLGRGAPDQVVLDLVDPGQRALRCDPLDV